MKSLIRRFECDRFHQAADHVRCREWVSAGQTYYYPFIPASYAFCLSLSVSVSATWAVLDVIVAPMPVEYTNAPVDWCYCTKNSLPSGIDPTAPTLSRCKSKRCCVLVYRARQAPLSEDQGKTTIMLGVTIYGARRGVGVHGSVEPVKVSSGGCCYLERRPSGETV